jgi:hypothetical protein
MAMAALGAMAIQDPEEFLWRGCRNATAPVDALGEG